MVRIAMSAAAYDAIASTLPRGLSGPSFFRAATVIRVEAAVLDPLRATRGPGTGLSVIGDLSRMRMTAMGGKRPVATAA
jgi:hypothetical protein